METGPSRSRMSATRVSATRPVVERARALVPEELERIREPRLLEAVARVQKLAAGRVDASALSEGHDGREHRQALGVRTGHVDTRARKLERGLHEALPLESPVALPELSEAGRHSGHRAGGDAHLVVDDLVPERDADVLERARRRGRDDEPRDRDEEVEETRLAARCRRTRPRALRRQARS